MKVKVELDDINTYCEKLTTLITEFNDKIADYKTFAVGKTDIWESKYQKVFDKHITNEFIPYCNQFAKNCTKLNNHLKKSINDYKKIDSSRM